MAAPVCGILVAVLLCLPAADALAWGDAGHRIISDIAWPRLAEGTRTRIRAILKSESPGDAAIWADGVTTEDGRDTRPLHYLDVPAGRERIELERDCPDFECVVGGILRYQEVLRNPEEPDAQLPALKFVIHFVGDVHQPLHTAFADGEGGTRVRVRFFGRRTNLHWVWDVGLIERQPLAWRSDLLRRGQNLDGVQLAAWSKLDPLAWARESNRIAGGIPYPRGELGDAYVEEFLPLVERQLLKAGTRLAALLNETFAREVQRPEGR
jgi:hypothetical protein